MVVSGALPQAPAAHSRRSEGHSGPRVPRAREAGVGAWGTAFE